jgi:hypothetical protein
MNSRCWRILAYVGVRVIFLLALFWDVFQMRTATADIKVSCQDFAWTALPHSPVEVCLNCIETDDPIRSARSAYEYLGRAVPRCPEYEISVTGEIRPSDIEFLKIAIEVYKTRGASHGINFEVGSFTISLNSDGGDVATAMRLAEILFDNRAFANVERCYSACVLVMAGLTFRYFLPGRADVRIHRIFPSQVDKTGNYENFLEQENKGYVLIAEFLGRFGVSPQIVDEMRATPSSELRSLSIEDLERFGLGKKNARYEDELRFEITRTCGEDTYRTYLSDEKQQLEIGKRCAPRMEWQP